MALAQLRLPGGVLAMRFVYLAACAAAAAASDVGAMQGLRGGAASDANAMQGFGRTSLGDTDKSILQSLKALYAAKLRPLEAKGKFHEIGGQPALSDAWFDSKPIVLLIGQYSVGKTSFIRYLLGRDFPGQRVGPEPTTDRFVAIMHGDADKVTPGNALTAQSDAPFSPLKRFGTQFLNRFEAAQLTSPILKRCVLVDSPGVLSGDKQKNRGYDYDAVVQWWVQHADRILLLFDAHKLDMSDEFKAIVNMLGEHAGKARRRAAPRRAILLGAQFCGAEFGAIVPTASSFLAGARRAEQGGRRAGAEPDARVRRPHVDARRRGGVAGGAAGVHWVVLGQAVHQRRDGGADGDGGGRPDRGPRDAAAEQRDVEDQRGLPPLPPGRDPRPHPRLPARARRRHDVRPRQAAAAAAD
jgi:hypothetical protein